MFFRDFWCHEPTAKSLRKEGGVAKPLMASISAEAAPPPFLVGILQWVRGTKNDTKSETPRKAAIFKMRNNHEKSQMTFFGMLGHHE